MSIVFNDDLPGITRELSKAAPVKAAPRLDAHHYATVMGFTCYTIAGSNGIPAHIKVGGTNWCVFEGTLKGKLVYTAVDLATSYAKTLRKVGAESLTGVLAKIKNGATA